ncbi:MAG: helix-turn-helix transcriptional regulator [Cyclobacteriaceae bacterium]|nr:helix-turn-helix transcriptional regulator [Cyclobacteriaceae bacterium]
MVLSHKEIKYLNKRVFEKVVMSIDFKRGEKYFTENEACFLFLKNGSLQFRTPTHVLTYTQNEAMLAKCGDYFIEPLSTSENEKTNTITAIGAFFYPDVVKGLFGQDLSLHQLNSGYDVLKIDTEPWMRSFIDSLDFLLDNPSVVDDNVVVNKLRELILLLSKNQKAESVHQFIASLFVAHEYNFREIIQANTYADLTLEELAHLCGMSLSTFKRTFKNTYHETPAHYFRVKRLQKAAELLKNTTLRISDICYECGFKDVSYFSKAFNTHYKINPSEFRISG